METGAHGDEGEAGDSPRVGSNLASWNAEKVKSYVEASPHGLSPEAKEIVGKLDGATLARLNKDELRALGKMVKKSCRQSGCPALVKIKLGLVCEFKLQDSHRNRMWPSWPP